MTRRALFALPFPLLQTKLTEKQTKFKELETSGVIGEGSRDWMTAGPAPADTSHNGKVFDAVVFVDQTDMMLKVRMKSGQVYAVSTTQ